MIVFLNQVDKDILPSEFGGGGGPIDNSACIAQVVKLDGYFEQLKESKKK